MGETVKIENIKKDGNYYSAWKALNQSDSIELLKRDQYLRMILKR